MKYAIILFLLIAIISTFGLLGIGSKIEATVYENGEFKKRNVYSISVKKRMLGVIWVCVLIGSILSLF